MIKLTFAKMQAIKDYYRILNVKASATTAEIKNAYRKLAMKYHPDHNIGDELAANIFADVAEAYKILSHTSTRKEYNDKRYVTAENEYQKPVETIEQLISRMRKINKIVRAYSKLHFNKDALLYSIKQLLPDDVSTLTSVDNTLLENFITLIVEAAAFLSSHQTKQLIILLQPLFNTHEYMQQSLDEILLKQQKQERWEKNKIILVVIVALILCIVIFLAAGK